jgi:hypothetical protein
VSTNEVKNKCACVASPAVNLQENEQIGLALYPNPVSEKLHVEWDASLVANPEISIYDLTGKLLVLKQVNGDSGVMILSMENLENGSYILVLSSDSIRLSTKSFVKL